MVPGDDQITQLLKRYAPNEEYFELIKIHGEIVAEIALEIAESLPEDINLEVLIAACKLHDIGSYVFVGAAKFSPDFERNYPGHAIMGAKILQDEGLDDRIWQAVETHVLLGLTKEEIIKMGFALPEKDYLPRTIEARLLCYADRFHSKQPIFNSFDSFSEKLSKDLPMQAKKMIEWSEEFGVPDVKALAQKYGHPIR